MKYIKKVLKVVIMIIIIILFILVLDYIRLNLSYLIHKKEYIEAFDVQGNQSNYVPQGLAYSEKYQIVLQTSYNSKGKVSKLYVTGFKTGKLLKELDLLKIDGTNNTNHVGGIATNDETVWITSDYEVNEYSLEEIVNTNENSIQPNKAETLSNRGDFSYYNDGVLWIGDFFLNPFYPVPNNNPLLLGYSTNNLDYSTPNYIISLPKMVQGMTITSDNHFIFTSSFTNLIHSKLSIYENVLEENYEYYELNGQQIPYYHFDKKNLVQKINLPPMAEGLFEKDNHLYILFENSSNSYFYAFPKMKKVIQYDI
ncbi:MAG: hypothetical protein IJ629_02550 [Clostridia bacterium]|nr:hypothetical protein [Clostridia bacterium]